jgi:hypothetical protein
MVMNYKAHQMAGADSDPDRLPGNLRHAPEKLSVMVTCVPLLVRALFLIHGIITASQDSNIGVNAWLMSHPTKRCC